MTRDEAIALVSERIEAHKDSEPDALGLVLVSSVSPGPTLGIRCERLNYGTWGITVKQLPKVLNNLKQLTESTNIFASQYQTQFVIGRVQGQ